MRSRLISLAIAGILVLALPGSTLGWAHGRAGPVIADAWCFLNGEVSVARVDPDEQLGGKPIWILNPIVGGTRKITAQELKLGTIDWSDGSYYGSITVQIVNRYGYETRQVTCPALPSP
jgi:hypothetical protein